MVAIQDQKLIYHLTSINNIGPILANGLMPRSMLVNFDDVADQEIIVSRQHLSLENYVPFHWFSRNPFDGRVQADRPNEDFVLITITRTIASRQNWKVIPFHPLAATNIELLDYEMGYAAIDWDAMNMRDYHNPHSKSVCMAECLSPAVVPATLFYTIFVSCDESAAYVEEQKKLHGSHVEVKVNSHMFLS